MACQRFRVIQFVIQCTTLATVPTELIEDVLMARHHRQHVAGGLVVQICLVDVEPQGPGLSGHDIFDFLKTVQDLGQFIESPTGNVDFRGRDTHVPLSVYRFSPVGIVTAVITRGRPRRPASSVQFAGQATGVALKLQQDLELEFVRVHSGGGPADFGWCGRLRHDALLRVRNRHQFGLDCWTCIRRVPPSNLDTPARRLFTARLEDGQVERLAGKWPPDRTAVAAGSVDSSWRHGLLLRLYSRDLEKT